MLTISKISRRMGQLLGQFIRHQPVYFRVLQDAYRNRNSFGRIPDHREVRARHAVAQLRYRYDFPFRPRTPHVTALSRKIVLSDLYRFPFHVRSSPHSCWPICLIVKAYEACRLVTAGVSNYRFRRAFDFVDFAAGFFDPTAPGLRPSPIFFANSLRCFA